MMDFYVTIFDGEDQSYSVNLKDYNKEAVTFGRSADNDIILKTDLVGRYHGAFRWEGDTWVIYDNNSTNGIFWNSSKISSKRLVDGDKMIIGYEQTSYRVALIFSQGNSSDRNYISFPLYGKQQVIIGRGQECDIQVQHTAVYRQHCRILVQGGRYYLQGAFKDAAIQYNGIPLMGYAMLSEMDRFLIGDTLFIFQNGVLHYMKKEGGLGFEVSHLSKIVGKAGKRKKINTDINLTVNAGEFVAIIGGSGAGKSTLLKCLCGFSTISEGNVIINGEDLATNYNSLKQLIGYVPQEDIVYDNLSLKSMLYYTAKLRMPKDSSNAEIEARIDEALKMVELLDKKDVMIKSLSGGQKKRASIAVELLSDPKLFFLDEPTSGLDPGTERNLMVTLKEMTKYGKTVVLVTHTPLNLHLCDKIIIMGNGGRLCFCGKPKDAEAFFGVNNLVDIYNLVNNEAPKWADKFASVAKTNEVVYIKQSTNKPADNTSVKGDGQLGILIRRYVDLQIHDLKRVLMQLLMAPGLALLMYIAFKDTGAFGNGGDVQKLSLTMGCCAFWVGLFNTIQEICKEKQIYRRERMANLRLTTYISSKFIVNGVLSVIQTLLLLGVLSATLGLPDEGQIFSSGIFVEMFITTYLTMLSAACMGLAVSAVVDNSDQAISVAPILLIPQILFSGVIVGLEGIVNKISYFISCRHACVAFQTTANVNALNEAAFMKSAAAKMGGTFKPDSKYEMISQVEFLEGDFGDLFANPIMFGWTFLIILSAAALAIAYVALKKKKYQ